MNFICCFLFKIYLKIVYIFFISYLIMLLFYFEFVFLFKMNTLFILGSFDKKSI